ncbi:MAG: D-alanine--D-alanine ligase [Bdellovibrionales bacterium]|nr:D-alanine--D-alanine ligase [Bdellovibrionales bacterium]
MGKQNLKEMKVALIQGGVSAERDVSLSTGQAFDKALSELGVDYIVVDAKEDLPKVLSELRPKVNVALLALHGKLAEDGVVQGICEYLKLPYTGTGVLGSSVAFDKLFSKMTFKSQGIPTAEYVEVNAKLHNLNEVKMPFALPLVVKPSREGSSVGVSIVKSDDEFVPALEYAAKSDHLILIEQYLDGKEITIPVLGERALTPIEIRPKVDFYNYENKYTAGNTDYILPPEIPEALVAEMKELALRAHKILRARVYSRVDFRLHQGRPFVIEVNTLPGCTPTSLVPKSAAHEGIGFSQFIQVLLENAGLDYEDVR